jgi:hypothetical protein
MTQLELPPTFEGDRGSQLDKRADRTNKARLNMKPKLFILCLVDFAVASNPLPGLLICGSDILAGATA